ncbi:MAG TPA: hypothetical protein VNZ86_01045 [Bacteroidia bacterium]|jgi:hypothetical protein|nr:hypothetical protein [Bacteroidia bacterium]
MPSKNSSRLIKGFLFLALSGFLISGCKKNSTTDTDTTASNENAFSESTYNDAGNISDQAASNSMSSFRNGNDPGYLLSSCATITRDSSNHSNPDTIVVSFGATNCLCKDGRYRRGIIFITYTKPHYWDSLNVITITFQNYYVNDYGVSGTKTITNRGRISGQPTYDVTVTNGMITKPSGGSFTWNATRERKQIAGQNTPFWWGDDKYSFTGSANGVSSNGNGYNAVIVSPLIRDFSCLVPRWFTQGILDFTPTGKATRVIDFGSGTCDDICTVTINSTVYTIHMW